MTEDVKRAEAAAVTWWVNQREGPQLLFPAENNSSDVKRGYKTGFCHSARKQGYGKHNYLTKAPAEIIMVQG